MNKAQLALAARIRQELAEIDRVIKHVNVAWKRAQEAADGFYLVLRSTCTASTPRWSVFLS
ncbi:MAG TPA: hypothetical protein GX511_07530 [Firmicutes bacterium]|nr:hypothetical protein [Bacillota bacterium]